eukprot:1144103-Pelagomonas_calceolata.AAC.3
MHANKFKSQVVACRQACGQIWNSVYEGIKELQRRAPNHDKVPVPLEAKQEKPPACHAILSPARSKRRLYLERET